MNRRNVCVDPVSARRPVAVLFAAALSTGLLLLSTGGARMGAQAPDPCAPPLGNPVVCENQKAGAPASEWDVSGAGDASIQGFSTDISVNRGQPVSFKIATNATNYRLDIYRMGYYGGFGARKIATVLPSATLPQNQPNCLSDAGTGLVDCGNWAISASWTVPSSAMSGIYFAKVTRTDTGGASHIVFVVRDDTGHSDLLFQTSDTTWQAYNRYGGNSLYTGNPAGRAYKVSYNRPLTVRGDVQEDSPFNAEYPMVRWLEANGFNVSYFTGVDSARSGSEILEHKVFLSVGHDEYWSGTQRTNVEAARAAGVHLAFFSGNEAFWKTRWENSVSPSATPYRTLVTYKETHANAKIDPSAEWTGTWRDPRFSPPADGGRPENALTGTLFAVNAGTAGIRVPASEGRSRFWRNTPIAAQAAGGSVTLPDGTLGYEWDEDRDNGFRPSGLMRLSDTTVSGVDYLQDYGSTYGPGTANHALTLYRHGSGALVFGAGTVQWSWGLDGNHDRGSTPPSIPMQQATVNLFADMGVQPLTLQAGLVPASGSSDTVPPTSTITSPVHNSGVAANVFVTVVGTASDAGGGVVAGVEVSVDGGNTWRRANGRENWSYSWQTGPTRTVTLLSRAVDDSSNQEQPVTGVVVNVGSVTATCPCSLWTPTQGPSAGPDTDPQQVELGTRFHSNVAGYVSAIRFYKHAQNGGAHAGNLWNGAGLRLSTVNFIGESASGWQEATLPAPIAIAAGTDYVVSYNTSSGFYAGEDAYFATSGVANGPLLAPASGAGGGNGVYAYGANTFPAETYNSENYWVDVVFVTSIGPDTAAPTISLTTPATGAAGALVAAPVTAIFSENVTNVTSATFRLTGPDGPVAATVGYTAGARTATLTPASALAYSTAYSARLSGGASGIKDISGNALAADYVWSFTTSAPPPPPPDEGPGGPILVVGSSADPFSRYYAEILRAEGLNSFTATDLSLLTPALLSAHDVVILGAIPLTTSQVTLLTNWVTAGGNLIAMRPDKKLAPLLGITDSQSTLAQGYLLVNNGAAPGTGITNQTMQFHGVADRYALNGATAVAVLYSSATAATTSPAVTLRSVGTQGGQAAAFTFDLARSIVFTRQGNPAWSGQERDGVTPLRSGDLFFGGAEPDWIDLGKVAIPQADEQQRLLANLLLHVNSDRRPLPRFWYFPRGEKAVVVMTGDDHANGGTAGRFDIYKNNSPVNCRVDDWECVRATSYIYPSSPISAAQAAAYAAEGFELAPHIFTGCSNYTPSSLDANYAGDLADFASLFPGVPRPRTNRTHCIVWSDFDTQPQVALAHGIRLDTNYYYYPGAWIQDRPGFMTGSGMPMRFGKADGSLIDVYQAATQMTDESDQTWPFTIDTLLDRALGPDGYYGFFTANMHTDSAAHDGSVAIVASAQARSVPIISAAQLLTWLDGRNSSAFSNITWDGSVMGFTVAVGAGANGLEGMLPATAGGNAILGLTKGGTPVPYRIETIKGISYAIFAAGAGAYSAPYGIDTTPPVITAVTVTASGGAATIGWTTSEAADTRVDYGLAPNALTLTATAAGITSAHTVQLQGLGSGTVYYYRVRSADPAGNAATSPAAPAAPSTFTTLTPPSLGCPCSIWSAAQAPAVVTEPDASAIELGLKFRASSDGFITSIRFYKGPQNIGVHTGHLWTATGTLLSTVTFINESASGWQVARLLQPVAVTANTTYVVSYYSPIGFYSADGAYFTSATVTGPLEALSNAASGGNGLFRYGASGFPSTSFNGTNYWVDVVFATSITPDTVPPTIVGTALVNGAAGGSAPASLHVMFSEAVSAASVNGASFQLRDQASNLVNAVVSYDPGTADVRLQPSTALAFLSNYTVTVKGGSAGVRDLSGNALVSDYTWSFTTGAEPPPPPDQGPGGPILVVSGAANPFTKYYAEILRAEGLNAFLVSDITAVTPASLGSHQIVILGEIALSPAQVALFTDWVFAGGKLIAMRPDKQLAGLLGLTDANASLSNGYLKVDTSTSPGTGIVGESMQFHGVGDLYALSGAVTVAKFYSSASTEMTAPAVTIRSVGSAGGQVAAFLYDLARSVVYTRQGNPAWAGQDRDGQTPIRSDDLFFGGTEPNYVDLAKVAIPQADEQQRLLANLIARLSADRMPLPRFGYFPRGHKAVVVMTGDDHANNGTPGQFDFFSSRSTPGCSVIDWECVRSTSYIYPSTPIAPAAASAYVAQGFEIGVHISTGCSNYTAASLADTYTTDLNAFASVFVSLPSPQTNRTHCIVWSDYTSQAEVALAHGIRLDTNYYYWPAAWVNNLPGVFTGSAMPMRFAKADGTMLDVYQAATQMTDESGQTYPMTINALLDRALGPEGYYGAYVANMHTDTSSHPGAQAIVASAQDRGVPVISAKQLLDWVDGRNASSYKNLSWVGNALTFTLAANAKARGLQLLLAATSGNRVVTSVTRDGQSIAFSLQWMKGVQYVRFDSPAGQYSVEYTIDNAAPMITAVGVSADAFDATVTWTTNEPATSRVLYGTSPNGMSSTAVSAAATAQHSLTLTGLSAGSPYYFRVASEDVVGNGATAPLPPAAPMTFTTLTTPTFGCPCSLWDNATQPSVASTSDAAAIELGLRFRPSANGYVTAIRFYKGPLNTGPHVGNLWSSSGTLLGTAVFTNESPTGWQVANLAHAVAVAANTTYVVSYHTDSGGYAASSLFFAGSSLTSGPLQAPGTDLGTANGVFHYGASGFPSDSYNSTNYWVDLVFVTTLPPPPPPSGLVGDTTTSDFQAGAPGGATYVAASGDGEVVLRPAFAEEFSGVSLPTGWSATPWNAGGSVAVADGRVSVDGSLLVSDPLLLPNQSLEFRTTFSGTGAQHAGFAVTFNESRWAIFSSGSGGALLARTHDGVTAIDTPLSPDWLGASHLFRIDWTSSGVAFFIDGTQVAAHAQVIDAPMRPAFSDFNVGSGALAVEFVRMGPYATAGTFTSRVLDGGSVINWESATSTSTVPVGTALTLAVRFGNTAIPDGSWSAFSNLALGAAAVSGTSRYVQYRATLSGSGSASPALEAIAFDGLGFTALPVVSIASTSVVEAGSATTYAVFTVSLSTASSAPVSVTYATSNGTATAGSDYSSVSGTAVIPAGSTSLPILVPVAADSLVEPAETFQLTLSAPVNAILGQAQATATIFDQASGALSIADRTITETNAGVTNALFTITLPSASPQTVTVAYATFNGTAVSPQDYAAVSGTATFAPGVTSVQIAVPVLGDSVDENDETFTVVLSSPVNAFITKGTAVGTITDDDAAPSLTIGNVTVTEGDAAGVTAVFAVSLSAVSGKSVTVNYATANGTAVAPADYSATSGTLTLAPGTLTGQIAVPLGGDLVSEPGEAFVVGLSSAVNATIAGAQGVGTIADNDSPPSLVIGDASVTEGNTGTVTATFTVTLSSASGQTVTVSYATANGPAVAPADYTAASGTLTFSPGTTTRQVTVATAGDSLDEADETFVVNLSAATNATIADAQGVGTIVDNDAAPALAITNASVTEGNTGTITATFTVTLSAVSGRTVTVNYATANGAAVAPADYTATTGTLTFGAGVTTQQIAVAVAGDVLDEVTETFVVNLSVPTNATLANAQGVGTITDNDAAPALTINDGSVTEGNTGTANAAVTVTLSAASGQAITVNYATANGTAGAPGDYSATSGVLTIPAGATSGQVVVPVVGDVRDEPNETFLVTISAPTNATIARAQATETITDNDAGPSIAVNNATTASEGNSGTAVTAVFTVTLSTASSFPITVNYSTSAGTAISPADFVAKTGTVSFAPDVTSAQVTVSIVGDVLDENNETFNLNLSGPTNATIGDALGVATITDDDATPSVVISNPSVTEPNTGTANATFTVTMSAVSGRAVSVNYATQNVSATSGADYTAATGTVTIPAGAASGQIIVPVLPDTLDEADETYNVNLSGAVSVTIADTQGVGTIVDNDNAPTISINDITVTEGAAGVGAVATFTVSLSAASGRSITVAYATGNGNATAPSDYTAKSGTLTFAPGVTTQTITVNVIGDGVAEGNELFGIGLSAPANATIADSIGVCTILNDD